MTICPPCGQTELGLWPYRPPPDDLVFETLSHPKGARGGPRGIPDEQEGEGGSDWGGRREGEGRLEAGGPGEERGGNGWWGRADPGGTRGRGGRGGGGARVTRRLLVAGTAL